MVDLATPNLPARDFDATEAFYGKIGFSRSWRDPAWMILVRGDLRLEFFPYPDLDPATSSFGSCLRVDDLDTLISVVRAAEIPEARTGFPRFHPPRRETWGGLVGAVIDLDGSLLRLIQN